MLPVLSPCIETSEVYTHLSQCHTGRMPITWWTCLLSLWSEYMTVCCRAVCLHSCFMMCCNVRTSSILVVGCVCYNVLGIYPGIVQPVAACVFART